MRCFSSSVITASIRQQSLQLWQSQFCITGKFRNGFDMDTYCLFGNSRKEPARMRPSHRWHIGFLFAEIERHRIAPEYGNRKSLFTSSS